MSQANAQCALCKRKTRLTFHHLYPKKIQRRKRFKRDLSRDEREMGILVCRPCHNGLHRMFDEMTLASELNTLEKIESNEKIMKHVRWVAKQRVSDADDATSARH